MTIAVDFDGTIVEHKYPAIGKELPFALDTLKKFADSGHKLILWTVRDGKLLEEAVEFCRKRGVEFYAVNSDYPGEAWNNGVQRKVSADLYIDDRNLGGIPDWNMIYEMVSSHLSYSDLLDRMRDDDDMVIFNGTYKTHSSHHHHRRGVFRWIADRCREARFKYRH